MVSVMGPICYIFESKYLPVSLCPKSGIILKNKSTSCSLFHFFDLLNSDIVFVKKSILSVEKMPSFLMIPKFSKRFMSKTSLSVKNSSKSFSPVVSLFVNKHGHIPFLVEKPSIVLILVLMNT